jgi:hypothetical protein
MKVIGGYFGGRRPVEQPTGRWENTLWRDGIDLLQTRSWNEVVKNRELCRKESGEAVTRKCAEEGGGGGGGGEKEEEEEGRGEGEEEEEEGDDDDDDDDDNENEEYEGGGEEGEEEGEKEE